MSAREDILKAIAANKPAAAALPVIDKAAVISYADLVVQYKTVLQGIGGTAIELSNLDELKNELAAKKAAGEFVVNRIAALGAVDDAYNTSPAAELAGVELTYVQGELAVAENGAVWLTEKQWATGCCRSFASTW